MSFRLRRLRSQKRHEAGLLKMMVRSQGFRDVALAHHDKRDAISKGPALVAVLVVQFQAAIKEVATHGRHLATRSLAQVQQEIARARAALGIRERVGEFRKNPIARQERCPKAAGKSDNPLMMLVPAIEPREKIKGVREDGFHRRGEPWT